MTSNPARRTNDDANIRGKSQGRPPSPGAIGGAPERRRARLVDVMSRRQRWIFRALLALWLVALTLFWRWWLQEAHWASAFGMVVNSLLLAWATILPGWFFFFVGRMRRPDRRTPLVTLRTAIVVTKAPSEPWPMVRETLEAMLGQRLPYRYDTWLADEDPSEETLAWCLAHGVQVSCRRGIPEYNRPTWPRRARCKEGNLAYFYDRWGYRDYDVVAQLDADHVPTPDYLAAMVRPFANPRVGYVAAPSICDRNRDESWVVRARLFVEATLHGALQAGYNQHYAPLCIGSHYAVRAAALEQVGGLGPDLAEDHTTTLALNAGGWEGVFAFDAEAHGDGAGSFADSIVQELQWSRSLANVLLTVTGRHWAGLSRRKKVQFGFAQAWYPLYAVQMLVAHLLPPLALLTGQPWVRVDLLAFFAYSSLVTLSCVAATEWVRRQGWLRPASGRLLSWETVLFQFARWPWVLLAVLQAVAGWLTGRQFGFKVTPKGAEGAKPLPLVALAPYLALAVGNAAVALAVGRPGPAVGYYWFCLVNATIYIALPLAIVWLHLRENRTRLLVSPVRFVGPHLGAVGAVGLLVAAAWAVRGERAVGAALPGAVAALARWELVARLLPVNVVAVAALGGAAILLFRRLSTRRSVRSLAGPTPSPARARPLWARPAIAALVIAVATAAFVPRLDPELGSAMSRAASVTSVAAPAATTATTTAATAGTSAPVTAVTAPPLAAPAVLSRRDILATADTRFFGAYDPGDALLDGSFGAEMFYTDLAPQSLATLDARLAAVAARGRTPTVTLEPWPLPEQGLREDTLLADLAAGRYDAPLSQVGGSLHRYGGRVLVRFAHEMDLSTAVYPWGGSDPARYIAAYRHVHALLRQETGDDLRWIWSPAGNANAAPYYPGDDVVDFVGITLLGSAEFDAWSGTAQRRSFRQLLDEKYPRARAFGKPVLLAELGVSGAPELQEAWLREMFPALEAYPDVRGVIYFNAHNAINQLVPDPPDYSITNHRWWAGRSSVVVDTPGVVDDK